MFPKFLYFRLPNHFKLPDVVLVNVIQPDHRTGLLSPIALQWSHSGRSRSPGNFSGTCISRYMHSTRKVAQVNIVVITIREGFHVLFRVISTAGDGWDLVHFDSSRLN
jgi:hypothetical protein